MVDVTEQWKLDGRCSDCRRAEFCRKDCTAKKRRQDAELRAVVNTVFAQQYQRLFAGEVSNEKGA